MNQPNEHVESLWASRSKRLKRTAFVVLLAGIAGAALVYWLGSRTPAPPEDASMIGSDKAEQYQMGQLYGNWGNLMDRMEDALKNPGTQAAIILLVAGVIAGGCFYLSEPPDDDKSAAGPPPHA